ncbi:MAG: tripartite tricarboxylate transporter substrate binding protein [Betaproteobacteria bacterium]|nr:tripartite tricarboxylate transporter substrate binding protein [Betaproteobacteria bacterium]
MTSVSIFFAVIAASLSSVSIAQPYPTKPIRMIVPNAPGGLADTAARLVAGKLSESFGHQVIVDNRVGVGSTIGTQAAVRAAPDGYTLLTVFDSHATNPHLFKKLEYDTLADLAPISLLVRGPMLLVATPKLPASSVQEFVKMAKAKPGAINFLTVGPGSPARLFMELLKSSADIDVTMVSYKGAGPAMADLMSGQVDIMFGTIPTVGSLVKSGKLKPLAITSERRSEFAPGVPALNEAIPGFRAEVWVGMFAPVKTPADIINRLNVESVKVLATADLKARFADQGLETVGSTPAQLDQWLRFEMDRWGKVIRDTKITLE